MKEESKHFLETLFAPYRGREGETEARVEVRCLAPGNARGGNGPRLWVPMGRVALMLAARRAQAWAAAWNVCMGVLPRRGAGGKAADVMAAAWLWCDLDGAAEWRIVLGMLEMAGLPLPRLAVASGHGHHLYWPLRQPVALETLEARAAYRSVLRRLCAAVGGTSDGAHADTASAEVARILRLPGTLNHKDPRSPRPVRLVFDHPDPERWTLSAWRAALPAEPLPPPCDERMLRERSIGARFDRLLRDPAPVGTRHRRCLRLLITLRKRGADAAMLASLGEAFCAQSGLPLDEMRDTLEWVEKQV